jgi:hypothetical protein
MKKQDPSESGLYVVAAVFVTYKTVRAETERAALKLAEQTLVEAGATSANLCNWHAHKV